MKKILRAFLLLLLAAVVLGSLFLVATGRSWVFKALVYNYVNIDDLELFPYRTIKAGTPQPWPLSAQYMKIAPDTAAMGELERNRSVAFAVIHRDSLLYEAYWDGYNDSAMSNSFSMAKSYIGAMTGIALKEGLLKNLDQQVADFIPEYRNNSKGKLTLWQLLTMSAALNWDEAYASLFSVTTEAYYGKDLQGLMNRLEVVEEPGRNYNYQGGATQLLAMVLMRASGKSLSVYAEEKLWKPLGATHDAAWSLDQAEGMEKASCCIYSNALDFARLGALYLHKGNWKGKQLIDTAYIEASTSPAPLLNKGQPNTEYGYQWWISECEGYKMCYCRGILGQYVAVIPSLELVVVRLGHVRRQAEDGSLLDLPVYLKAAIHMAQNNTAPVGKAGSD